MIRPEMQTRSKLVEAAPLLKSQDPNETPASLIKRLIPDILYNIVVLFEINLDT
jgi:hypothetical protein